jgi:hypothetical protein
MKAAVGIKKSAYDATIGFAYASAMVLLGLGRNCTQQKSHRSNNNECDISQHGSPLCSKHSTTYWLAESFHLMDNIKKRDEQTPEGRIYLLFIGLMIRT